MVDRGEDWRSAARGELLGLRSRPRGWGYRKGASPAVEPTCLACLGLLATRRPAGPESRDEAAAIVADAADWLADVQRPDGSLGAAGASSGPGWPTPLGLLLWRACGGREGPRRRGVEWLLREQGESWTSTTHASPVLGHDPRIVGWPWVDGTHSWLEPTATAVLALRAAGLGAHPRCVEGLRLILDRAIEAGGWNYGNKSAFGNALRPQPAPTGLALLALARQNARTAIVDRAIRYLQEVLPGIRACSSLGWGLLGLRAWDSAPAEADRWLAEAFQHASGRPDAAPKLALLLLAGGDHGTDLFE